MVQLLLLSPLREALTSAQPEDEKRKGWTADLKDIARILQESLCDPHLDFGRFVVTTSFLAAALWSQFPGAGEGSVPRLAAGAKAEGPQCFRTRFWRPAPTRTSTLTPAGGAALGPEPEASSGGDPARPHLPLPGNPAPPRPPAWRTGSRGPGTHAAMAQPETGPNFLRPDPGWSRPVGGAGKPRLPSSCFRPGGEWRVGVRI